MHSETHAKYPRRRRRRPRPAPLSLKADTLTDESVHSSQSSLKSSSLSPLSSSPTNHNSRENPSNFKSAFRKSQKRQSPIRQIEAPKSPGILRSTTVSPCPNPHRYSPRNISPSPRRKTPSPSAYRSPAPSSPLPPCSPGSYSPYAQAYQPGRNSPRSPNTYSSHSPRSPSPHNLRTARFASQPAQMTSTNLALLASRRKMSLASQKTKISKKVDRRTSNWLELPGLSVQLFLFISIHNSSC